MHFQRHISRMIGCLVLGLCVSAGSLLHASGLAPMVQEATRLHPFASVGQVVADSGEAATGILIADRLVLTSAASFVEQLTTSDRGASFAWRWKGPGDTLPRLREVAKVHVFDNFLNVARSSEVQGPSLLRRSLMVIELSEPVEGASVPTNVETFAVDTYRMVVGFAGDRYPSGDARGARLHATRAGEAVSSRFGRVEGRLYQTGDLKAAKEALGGPVMSVYDGQWSIDGIVVATDPAAGETLVVGFDRTAADFMDAVVASSGAKIQIPERSLSEQDPNGRASMAIPLSLGTGRWFSIAPEADADYHRFVIERASNIVIESFGDLDVSGRLLNVSQQLIASDDDSGEDFNYRIDTLLNPGTYYLLTTPYSGRMTGDYGVSIQDLNVVAAASFRDAGFTSTMVMDLSTESAEGNYQIASSGEVDWFRVVIPNPGHFILQTSGDLDLKARIFRPRDGASAPFRSVDVVEVLDANDDLTGRQGNSVLDVFLEPGSYIVAIEARNSGEFGPYGLSTSFESETLAIVNGADSNGGFATAEAWSPGEVVEAAFDEVGDRDTYVFTLERATDLELSVTSPTDVAWFLYDSSLQQVAASGPAVVDPQIQQDLAAGTYYLMIAGFAEGEYMIR